MRLLAETMVLASVRFQDPSFVSGQSRRQLS